MADPRRRDARHDGLDARQVGVARRRGRRVDAHEYDPAALEHVGQLEGEGEPSAVSLKQRLDTRLVDRHLPGAERVDPVGVHVAADDVVAEIGEAGRGHEPDVAHADDPDGAPVPAPGGHPVGVIERAMATISGFVRSSRSVLMTQ